MAAGLVQDYVLGPLVRPVRQRLRPPADVHFAHPDLGVGPPPPEPAVWTDRAALYAEVTSPTLPRAFEAAYAAASAHGVEPRFPFADRRLVALSLALPAEQRLQDGLTRSVLRRALADRLPPPVRDRTDKARLGRNFTGALFERSGEALRRAVYDDVRHVADLVDVPALQGAYERAVREPASQDQLALPLWRAVALARWAALGGGRS
jgi:asparagine synthase (glutamine-hydrolysing)